MWDVLGAKYQSGWQGCPKDPACIFRPSRQPSHATELEWVHFSFGGELSLGMNRPKRHVELTPINGLPSYCGRLRDERNGSTRPKAVIQEVTALGEWANTLVDVLRSPHLRESPWTAQVASCAPVANVHGHWLL